MEITAKKLLFYKYIQQECSAQEAEQVGRWMKEDDQDETLHSMLEDAWQESQVYPALDTQVSADIFQRICRTTGIREAFIAPVPAESPAEAAWSAKWLFWAAGMAILLVMAVVPRKKNLASGRADEGTA